MRQPRGPRFSLTRFGPGYSIAQVDALVERIEAALAGQPGANLTAEDVRRAEFTVTRLRPGYDQREVDLALDEYQERLRDIG